MARSTKKAMPEDVTSWMKLKDVKVKYSAANILEIMRTWLEIQTKR